MHHCTISFSRLGEKLEPSFERLDCDDDNDYSWTQAATSFTVKYVRSMNHVEAKWLSEKSLNNLN